ncbi:MAG: DNA-directed RNA polymerase subunit omega [Planctomycetota bacterium]|jgi:DNA-directed RNA polymerase subunit omega
MLDLLKDDEMIDRFGGRFKLCALIQRRWLQLLQGARPMVETEGLNELEVVMKEIADGKIEMDLPEPDEFEDEEANIL